MTTNTPTSAATGERSAPMRGPSFWILVFILVFSPLPLASVGPVWSHLYSLLVATGLIAYLWQRWHQGRALPGLAWPMSSAGGLIGLVALWGYLQAVPGLFATWAHPLWVATAASLQEPGLLGTLSLAPDRSVFVATNLLTYLGFGLLLLWHTRRQRNTELLLKIFLGTQAACAIYGLTIYFSGFETILWFDKTSYRGVLTSTFVNRNSYATYAGLGILTALVLVLRFLRHTLSTEKSDRTKAREFLESLTSSGWLPPMILLLCFSAVLLTQSRMGLTAVLVAATVLLIGWTTRLRAGQARTLGTILVALLLTLLVVNFVLSGGLTMDRFTRLFENGDLRFLAYPLMLDAIAERPWTGYGLGAFESAFRLVSDETITAHFDRGHSDYLELIMDVGWPAAMAVFLAFLLLLLVAWRLSRRRSEFEFALLSFAATVQIGIHSAVDFSMQIPAVVFAYLLLALAGIGTFSHTRRDATISPESQVAAFSRS
ncbi:O-antigen ligase family protein [Thiocystis violacea]|uniref:O-antigen ligase family protein n=1 Tax=Thiocystis violacea TaxID=13725 RepID=UPI001905164E|nr:O-antigen ligase family protein [Thiocystis violacea]MBK1719639.1 hypothetical protein [Thiocystis violacea]